MRSLTWALCIVILTACGCGQSDPLRRQAVSGKITLGGKPLKTGTVEFTPVGNGILSGASVRDGQFSIAKDKGLPPGDYVVRISASNAEQQPVEAPGESNKISAELVPAKYNSQSTLQFHVDAEKQNVFDIDLDSK